MVDTDHLYYNKEAEELHANKSLSNLDALVTALSTSAYNAALLNSRPSEEIDISSQDIIFPTIEDLLATQNSGEVNSHEWQKVRDEAVEYIRKDICKKGHENWLSALN